MSSKELSFENEGWNRWLDRVDEDVSEHLGVPGGAGSIQAELYKLLIYEEGAFFKPHKDTEKTKNMLGTLVVCLPSEHVGGAVRLIHGKEERLLETDKWSSYGVSYLAWYSDVSHEVLPIQCGYRFVLTYNLVNTALERHFSATVLDNEQSKIDQMLADGMPSKHKYTDANLRLHNLKGDDYYRCSQLDRACQSNGRFCVFLARLELTVTRINEEEYWEEEEEKLCLNGVVTLQGTQIQVSLGISKDCLVQRNVHESREHDEQWGGEHLGNQHADIQQVYRDAVAVIVSRDHMTEFLLGNGHRLEGYCKFLKRLLTHLRDPNGDERHLFREMIAQSCQKHIERRYTNTGDKDHFMGATAVASLYIGNPEAAKAALHAVEDTFDTSTFESLGRMGFQKTRAFCTEAFSRTSKLHLVDRGLRAYRSGIPSADQPDASKTSEGAVYKWAVDTLCEVLNSTIEVLPQDAGAVVQIMDTYEDERLWKSMDAFVGRFLDDATFANALLAEILCYSKTVQKSDSVAKHLLPPILDRAIFCFRLQHFSSLSKPKSRREDYPFSSWPDIDSQQEKVERDAAVVASLYRQVARDNLHKTGQLLENIAVGTASIDQDDFERFVIPLLREMIDITEHQPSEASVFYSGIISTYIERVVQKEPPKPQDWSLPDDARKCYESNCTYCSPVRQFLENTSQEYQEFLVPEDQRYVFLHHMPYHYKWTEERSGEHRKVKVNKSLEPWKGKHEEWRRRADRAQRALRSLPETPLRQCLGDGEYEDLMELRIVKVPTEDMIKGSANPVQAEAATGGTMEGNKEEANTVGDKRKREDADLGGQKRKR